MISWNWSIIIFFIEDFLKTVSSIIAQTLWSTPFITFWEDFAWIFDSRGSQDPISSRADSTFANNAQLEQQKKHKVRWDADLWRQSASRRCTLAVKLSRSCKRQKVLAKPGNSVLNGYAWVLHQSNKIMGFSWVLHAILRHLGFAWVLSLEQTIDWKTVFCIWLNWDLNRFTWVLHEIGYFFNNFYYFCHWASTFKSDLFLGKMPSYSYHSYTKSS